MTSLKTAQIKDLAVTILDRQLVIKRNEAVLLSVQLGKGFPEHAPPEFNEISSTLAHYVWSKYGSLRIAWRSAKASSVAMDCYDVTWRPVTKDVVATDAVRLGEAHWYGGAEMYEQRWPINKQHQRMQPYVTNVTSFTQM